MHTEPGLELTRSFLVVAQELNFRRSAERLHVDQSALSRRIRKLEHLLGFTLFERSTREVSLTAAGRRFYEANAELMQGYAQAVKDARRVAEGKTGVLRIAYMAFAATELMPGALLRFRRAYPHVDTHLHYIRTQGQKLALARGDVDIGYMIGPFEHSEFHSIDIASDPLYVVTPRNHPLLRKNRIMPADIADHPLILGDMMEWEAYRWRLNELFSTEGIALDISLEASNVLALQGLVAAGHGITLCPESLMGFLGRSVEARPILHPGFCIQTALVWRHDNRSQSVRHFVEIARHLPSRPV
ncbi:MAG: LysR substrate-binding domain-containing protein [Lautropia sp.]|nr:LysR substrate-binding domain-containing protein [Lautropia sp.]